MDIEEGSPPQNGRGIGNDRRFSPDLSVQTEAVPIDNHFLPQYGEIVFFGGRRERKMPRHSTKRY